MRNGATIVLANNQAVKPVVVPLTFVSSIVTTGSIGKNITKTVDSLILISSIVIRNILKKFNQTILISGTMNILKVFVLSFSTTITITGLLAKTIFKNILGLLSVVGNISRIVSKNLSIAITLQGIVRRLILKSFQGTFFITGLLLFKKVLQLSFDSTIFISGSVIKNISKSLIDILTLVGNFSRKLTISFSGEILTVGLVTFTKIIFFLFQTTVTITGSILLKIILIISTVTNWVVTLSGRIMIAFLSDRKMDGTPTDRKMDGTPKGPN